MKHRARRQISHTSSFLTAHIAIAAALCFLLPGCAQPSPWDSIALDAGIGISLPMLGVSVDPHVRLNLGKRGEDRAKAEASEAATGGPALSGDELLALAKLRSDPAIR